MNQNHETVIELVKLANFRLAEALGYMSQVTMLLNEKNTPTKKNERAPRSKVGEIKTHSLSRLKIKYTASRRDPSSRFKIYEYEALCPECHKSSKFESSVNIYRVIESKKNIPLSCNHCDLNFFESDD